MRRLWVGAIVLLVPLAAQAEMPSEANIKAVAEAWLAKKPAPGFGATMTIAEAAKVQVNYTALIAKDLGRVVGYKAGLTNPAVQKRFNYDKPLRGTLFEKMILQTGARVPAAYGARPVLEADMMAVVGDAAKLMAAKTPLEALAALKEIRTFIELPDILFDPQVKLDGTMLLGVNVLARLGVLGNPIPLPATADSVAKLAAMKVEVLDQTGAVLGVGKGGRLARQSLERRSVDRRVASGRGESGQEWGPAVAGVLFCAPAPQAGHDRHRAVHWSHAGAGRGEGYV